MINKTNNNLAAATANAANAARQLGLIKPGDLKALSDGRVSHADLAMANNIVARLQAKGGGGMVAGAVAQQLKDAISKQLDAQGGFETAVETAKDLPRLQQEIVRNIR